jgi:hypothetical protein
MTHDAQSRNRAARPDDETETTFEPPGSSAGLSSSNEVMPPRTEAAIRKVAEPDLEVGVICADRDGNRIRIDRLDSGEGGAGTLSYHFLNDELRVQEGIQERSIAQFLAAGWYMAAPGGSL